MTRRERPGAGASLILAGSVLVAACSTGPQSTAAPTSAPTGGRSPAVAGGVRPSPTRDVATATPGPSVSPSPSHDPLTAGELAAAVGSAQTRSHLVELQRIADAHGGHRAAGSPGFDASADYVATVLESAGYGVERHSFSFPFMDPATGADEQRESVNLIAELPGLRSSEVVVLGAHLDSVAIGPGINDNGSGSMTLLELATVAAASRPERTVRFAFWSAEESGAFGSGAYVDSLTAAERRQIVAYMNFDMLGSPNHIRFVYADQGAATGSEALTAMFGDYFDSIGLAWEPIDLTGHGDHEAFVEAGIPTGGLFSGGHEPKTEAQAAAFGGTAGVPADPCSHQACDTIGNIGDAALDEMADAVAHALATLAADD